MSSESHEERMSRFVRLYSASQRKICAYTMSMLRNLSDADDVIQETASLLWEKFDEFKPGTDFVAWALTIARFKVMSHVRNMKKRERVFSNELIEVISDVATSKAKKSDFRSDALRKCLGLLKESDRRLVEMRYEGGASVKSIALRTDVNINSLYKILNRIHERLLDCVSLRMKGRGAL